MLAYFKEEAAKEIEREAAREAAQMKRDKDQQEHDLRLMRMMMGMPPQEGS